MNIHGVCVHHFEAILNISRQFATSSWLVVLQGWICHSWSSIGVPHLGIYDSELGFASFLRRGDEK
jgi:hypothetical protein